jgi:VWFA-related protein
MVFSEEVAVEWVTVPVSLVKTTDGEEALTGAGDADLLREDFELRVDGRAVKVESFDHGAAPFGLLFAQDMSGSMAHGDKLRLGRNALALLLARAGELDEAALLTFGGPLVEVEVPFTSEFHLLEEATKRWRPYGTTALYDALSWVAEIARESHRSRRAVVLVTDGVDNASTIAADEARSLLQGAGLPVFVLDVASRFERAGMPVAPETPAADAALHVDPVAFSLAELAAATGGRYIEVADHAVMQWAADQVLRDLRQQYLLGFTTDGTTPSWHRIEVALRPTKGEPLRALRFRTRYYGSTPANWSASSAIVTSAAGSRAVPRRGRRPDRS